MKVTQEFYEVKRKISADTTDAYRYDEVPNMEKLIEQVSLGLKPFKITRVTIVQEEIYKSPNFE